ncbi:hypothetical protein ACQ4PT_033554 [Festuca glaucescens]
MKDVKAHYNLAQTSWKGDPCSPREYSWEGLTCDHSKSNQNPRIIMVNLSSSGLGGGFAISFMNMTSLESLDLSHNNLTGAIPDYQLKSLKVLNLSNNKLDGPIPDSILQRVQAGLLELRLEGNPVCSNIKDVYCSYKNEKKKKKNTDILLTAVIVPVVLISLLVGMCILWKLCWKGKSGDNEDYAMYEEKNPLQIDIRRFTYAELKLITNDFKTVVGKGGFGIVYHGTLENSEEVAVKVLMETSIAESTDFLPEVQTLSKVHHKNLVTLKGYCQNKKCLALVYDFMPRGNLQQVLRGGDDYSLNWEQRLHIAVDAAQGLEYLHELCTPSIVHRDVKTPNILLDKNLVGIISDFGLSRAFNDAHTHISTVAAGTLGYLDPEYHATFQLTVKTDVYSFGIVLLEIITGQPPVVMDPHTIHLPNWVRQKIAKGSIHDVVDKRLLDQYDAKSLENVVDIAMNCVENASIDRPTMTEVVSWLKVWLPAVSGDKLSASGTPRRRMFLASKHRKNRSTMVISFSCSASTKLTCIFALLLILVKTIQVHGQSASGFLSIDCGWTNSSDYVDNTLKLLYNYDGGFVGGGRNHEILPEFMAGVVNHQQKTLRSFPDGSRNCYTLPSIIGKKYLLRATFTYGNYDRLNKTLDGSLFLFGLHIGVNFWEAVNLSNSDPSATIWKEVLTIAPSNSVSVCLINFSSGIPFISSLELRPLEDAMYPFVNTSVSISCFQRYRFGNAADFITRYPIDNYDRFWQSWSLTIDYSYPWFSLNTNNVVKSPPNNDAFSVPSAILQNASTLDTNYSSMGFSIAEGRNLTNNLQLFLPIFHFAEINERNPNRRFSIYINNVLMFSDFSPSLFQVESKYYSGQFMENASSYVFLNRTPSSSLAPLINAFEVYSPVRMENLTTDPNDGKLGDHEDYAMYEEETPLHIDIRRFTYAELKLITNNFQSIIGKGGFGIVYHGILENGNEVAVKVLVETSIAESTDFLPEVQTLSKVHHKNLVTLEGYCQNKKCLALVYDFMPRGNLQQLLRGVHDYSLNWEQRLHIALDAAQGLEYLHESCTPSIVHRDVKTPNILLDKNLVGIISDFGLSRAFSDAHTHISTVAAGTVGYVDPEYHATFQLTVKTDVYSFGIVLLEIITGQPPVFMDPQTIHLPNWVRQKIAKGGIHDIVDKRLLDQYDANSLQGVVDLAMNCVENAAISRPTMTEVVSRLKALLPAVSSEKQTFSAPPQPGSSMDTEVRRQFQLTISGANNEGSSSQSGYTGGMSAMSILSGR